MLANILENIDTGTLIGLAACLGLYVIALQLWAIADIIGQAMRLWWQQQQIAKAAPIEDLHPA